ncbi:MAG: hypothetical protein ABI435_02395 [Pseudolysinimonas sp.]
MAAQQRLGQGFVPRAFVAQQQSHAPTLAQFWRSDIRVTPGRKPAKWAGVAALWLGLIALTVFLSGMFFDASGFLVAVATPIGFVAVLFGLLAVIAGIGRGAGIFGLIFAVLGSPIFWAWVSRSVS